MGLLGVYGVEGCGMIFTLTGTELSGRDLSMNKMIIEASEMMVNPITRMTANRMKRRYVRPPTVSKKNCLIFLRKSDDLLLLGL